MKSVTKFGIRSAAIACALTVSVSAFSPNAYAAHPSGTHTDERMSVDVAVSSGNISMYAYVELRHNSPRWWTRVTPYCSNATCGGGASTIGTAYVEVRKRPVGGSWQAWTAVKSKKISADVNQSQWTDDSYNPTNSSSTYDRQIRSTFIDDQGKKWATPAEDL